MKKSIIILLISTLILTMVGCGKTDDGKVEENNIKPVVEEKEESLDDKLNNAKSEIEKYLKMPVVYYGNDTSGIAKGSFKQMFSEIGDKEVYLFMPVREMTNSIAIYEPISNCIYYLSQVVCVAINEEFRDVTDEEYKESSQIFRQGLIDTYYNNDLILPSKNINEVGKKYFDGEFQYGISGEISETIRGVDLYLAASNGGANAYLFNNYFIGNDGVLYDYSAAVRSELVIVSDKYAFSKTNSSEESSSDVVAESGSKSVYLAKCEQLENTLKVALEDKYSSGITVDMREATSIEYKTWDDLLNEIYGVLKGQLSNDEMDELKANQVNWIKIRDAKADEAASEVRGGSMEPLVYTSTLAESTKERCYQLINDYMK